jgi:hypothetical protein
MATVNEVLKTIEDDILRVLKKENKALTHQEIFDRRKLKDYSIYGWHFAYQKLISEKVISVKGNKYELVKK